jgi:branched-subunit amino acid ABC-type transport system permease component
MISAYLCAIGLCVALRDLGFTLSFADLRHAGLHHCGDRRLRLDYRTYRLPAVAQLHPPGTADFGYRYVAYPAELRTNQPGPQSTGIPTLLSGVLRFEVGDGIVQITWTKIFILVAALVGMIVLTWIIQHTRLGRICRATQQDRRMAAILGINTDR